MEAGWPRKKASVYWASKSKLARLKITLKKSMNPFAKMFEEGVKQALKLLKNPQLREGLREALAKGAESVFKAGKKLAKPAAEVVLKQVVRGKR